jgi:hypothetical protein
MDTPNHIRLECDAQRALEYKHQLDAAGFVVNQDYEWHYQKPVYNDFAWTDSEVSHVTFTFQNPAMATFFQLKWAR